ncbi:MAG: 3-isopropylmalate dehydratase small subunit [Pyrinomonadaceae bacterium]
MTPFRIHTGLVAPLERPNVDTDQIIPKQFLKRVERTGFGQFLFYDWRYTAEGAVDSSFVLNEARYQGASILVAGRNFGCGSSREHAPWALADYGFRAVIAPSFADIFANNCLKNGLLPVVLTNEEVALISERAHALKKYCVTVDLERCIVTDEHGLAAPFALDEFRRHCLLNGLDDIGLTLQHEAAITAYEARRPRWRAFADRS